MPPSRYTQTMLDSHILWLLERGIYRVDLETTQVFHRDRPNTPVTPTRKDHYLHVRLYDEPMAVSIVLHKLVWMAATMCVVPNGYEIHHLDIDPENNSWENLVCLHVKDHKKIHLLLNDRKEEEVTF